MPTLRFPYTDSNRIKALQKALDLEEIVSEEEKVLSIAEIHELRTFLVTFEGTSFVLNQSEEDEQKSEVLHQANIDSARMYISHFIQVLQMAAIRNEVKKENLTLYGFEEGKELELPDLSTEEEILKWGDQLIKGETERMYRGGGPIYNPPIAKVKVHYDLFMESAQSLKIYRQNKVRAQENVKNLRNRANAYLRNIWGRVEQKFFDWPLEQRMAKYHSYLMDFYYSRGEQLDVFG